MKLNCFETRETNLRLRNCLRSRLIFGQNLGLNRVSCKNVYGSRKVFLWPYYLINNHTTYFQGMLSAPVYVFIELHPQTHMEGRICDLYQFSFLLSQHIGRWSLLAISIDRLLAIKFPFLYQDNVRKHKKQVCRGINSVY